MSRHLLQCSGFDYSMESTFLSNRLMILYVTTAAAELNTMLSYFTISTKTLLKNTPHGGKEIGRKRFWTWEKHGKESLCSIMGYVLFPNGLSGRGSSGSLIGRTPIQLINHSASAFKTVAILSCGACPPGPSMTMRSSLRENVSEAVKFYSLPITQRACLPLPGHALLAKPVFFVAPLAMALKPIIILRFKNCSTMRYIGPLNKRVSINKRHQRIKNAPRRDFRFLSAFSLSLLHVFRAIK